MSVNSKFKPGKHYLIRAHRKHRCRECKITIPAHSFFFLQIKNGKEEHRCLLCGGNNANFNGNMFVSDYKDRNIHNIEIPDLSPTQLRQLKKYINVNKREKIKTLIVTDEVLDTINFIEAAVGNRLGEVKHYIKKKPEIINHRNIEGETALHLAARSGRLEIVKILLKNGADVHQTTSTGWTPLHYAACCGEFQTAKYLIKQGAVIQNDNGFVTPLHVTAISGKPLIAELLMENGADPLFENDTLSSPYQFALRNGHINVVQVMKKKIHEIDPKAKPPVRRRAVDDLDPFS